jgi:integrase
MPRFGFKLLTEIRRDDKRFLADLSQVTRDVDGQPVSKFSRNTLRLIICALRIVLNAAVEDGLIDSNPAAKIGKFAKSEKPDRQASAMTRAETNTFLSAVREVCPGWYAFF